MNKKLLSIISAVAITFGMHAQCDPLAHDWQGATFGVSPNPTLGETFATGAIGIPYNDVVFVKTPTSAGDINPDLGDLIQVDSLRLDSITIFNGIEDVQLSAIGLNVTCNNNGDSEDPCMFMPNSAYCGDISGTPTVAGTFDVKIFATIYFVAFGPQELPWIFENYSLQIDGTNNVNEKPNLTLQVAQNAPNPAIDNTMIKYELPQPENVNFTVVNLVGELVISKTVRGKKGENQLMIDTNDLETGIYLYTLQVADKKITRKMIVQN
jgi:hypothetical protein